VLSVREEKKQQYKRYNSLKFVFFCSVPPRLSSIAPIEVNFDAQNPQRVSFQCRIERGSADSLSVEWQYLNHTVIQSRPGLTVDKSQLETNKFIELRFDPVLREHFGNYSCVAKNLADSTYSIASLLIQCNYTPNRRQFSISY